MPAATPARVLIVTDRLVAAPELLDLIGSRAARDPAEYHMLVPNPAPAEWNPTHPERHAKRVEAERALAGVLQLVESAAGHPVQGTVSIRHDPMDAIEDSLRARAFDEIVLVLAPHNVERRLHVDLPHRLAHLGIPVTSLLTGAVALPA